MALLQRGADRAKVIGFVGMVYELTEKHAAAARWDRWCVAIDRRRGLIKEWIDVLHNLASSESGCGRYTVASAEVSEAQDLTTKKLPGYLERLHGSVGAAVADVCSDGMLLSLLLLEGRIHRDADDLHGALAATAKAIELASMGSDSLCIRAERLSRKFSRDVKGQLFDVLILRADLLSTHLHQWADAIDILRQAKEIAERLQDPAREYLVNNNTALPLIRMQAYAEARVELEHARRLVEEGKIQSYGDHADSILFGAKNLRLPILSNLANLARVQGRLDEAALLYDEVLSLNPGTNDSTLAVSAFFGYGELELARGNRIRAIELDTRGLELVEKLHLGNLLRVAHFSIGKAYEQGGSKKDLAEACRHYSFAIEKLERARMSLRDEMLQLEFLGTDIRVEPYERIIAASAKLGRASDVLEYAERGKERAMLDRLQAADVAAHAPVNFVEIAEMLAKVERQTLLVEYFTTPDDVIVVGVRPGRSEPDVAIVPLDRGVIRRFTLANFGNSARVRELLASGLEELWHGNDPLVSPIGDWSQPGDHVILVPHGPLHYLPLHVLRIGGQYLVERNTVSYAPSASILLRCRTVSRSRDDKKAVVFGDPMLDLPYSRAEASAVAHLFSVDPIVGSAVTKGTFLERAAAADIVHYAGHARFDAGDPMASGLYFAHNAILQARDISSNSLPRTRLVTLSGCETGVSLHHPGDEMIGLVRGFFYAGAPTVVASLWRVPDDSTAYLMDRFYAGIQDGSGLAKALSDAMLDTARSGRWASWYHWAPFVLIGDWE